MCGGQANVYNSIFEKSLSILVSLDYSGEATWLSNMSLI